MGMSTYQIDVPFGCFGVTIDNHTGRVVETAPMGKWMLGKTYPEIRAWVDKKRGTIKVVSADWL